MGGEKAEEGGAVVVVSVVGVVEDSGEGCDGGVIAEGEEGVDGAVGFVEVA